MKNLCFLIAVSFLCMVNCDKKINNNNDEPNFLKINIGENSVITNGLKGYIILYTDENCSTIKEKRFFSGQSIVLFQNISDSAVSFTVIITDTQSLSGGKAFWLESFIKAPKGEWYFNSTEKIVL